MGLDVNSLAAAVGSAAKNVQFLSAARNVERKVLIIGTYDVSKTTIVDEVPIQILSPSDAADKYGFGSMLHRLAIQAFLGGNGIKTFVQPQAEAGGAVASAGKNTWTASGTVAGTVHMYIAGEYVPFQVADADDQDAVSIACVAAVEANDDLGISAAVGAAPADSEFDAKSKGPWGDDISIAFNIGIGQEFPIGVSVVVTDMTGGSGIPDIDDALNGLGTGDDANEDFYTDVVHGYGLDTATMTKIAAYVGVGNEFTGLYDKLVGRPFRVLTGDVTADSAGLTALIVITDAKLTDRANGIIAAPGSRSHPGEIAAQAIGHMARINNNRAAESYVGVILSGIDPGEKADRWTSDYDNRDTAVKSGISPTKVNSGAVVLQNVVSFYRPASVPVESNGYRSMRNISILQNIIYNIKVNFSQEKWQGISLVENITNVTNVVDRLKARDTAIVIDDLVALAKSFESRAWIYTASFTIQKLAEDGAVSVRSGGTGFDSTLSIILSGEGGILDTVTEFDTSIAILLN